MDSVWQTFNIVVHVTCGTAALVIGLVQLVSPKGGARHRRLGEWFVRLVWAVVVTASLGLVLFGFRAFLAVLTLLVAYWTYSGLRTVRTRERGPVWQDGAVSAAALASVTVFVFYLPYVRVPWVPAIIYSTLATLALVSIYDLCRFLFPKQWHRELWLPEHVVKMLGAHAALAAAFSGTVLSGFQPFSQIAPSVVWTLLQVAFVVQVRRRATESHRLAAG